METVLSEYDSQIWEFPSIADKDNSVTKYDYVKILEDSHGAGSLEDADTFSYTTNNQDIWLLPSESYLKLTCKVLKTDGNDYQWLDRVAVDADAAAGVAAVTAKAAEDVNICDNAFNLFDEARYYIDDQEVERLDHLGIASLVNNLITYTDSDKSNSVKHSQLWFKDLNEKRKTYVKENGGTLQFLLPASKIFPFFDQINHVFRGVKHRITMTLNKPEVLLFKSAAAPKGKIIISKMEWMIPFAEPSLEMMSKLETQLAGQSSFNLKWNALNVYKHQPSKNTNEARIALASTIHKPKNIFVGLQSITRTNSQTENSMVFDHLNLEHVDVEINSIKFPDKTIENNFAKKDVMESYDRFLDGCKGKKGVGYDQFCKIYPIMHIDVSKHKPELYENTTFPNIVVNIKLKSIPTAEYIAWVIIYNEREASLNLEQKKMRVIR